jgi:hypothetical protein
MALDGSKIGQKLSDKEKAPWCSAVIYPGVSSRSSTIWRFLPLESTSTARAGLTGGEKPADEQQIISTIETIRNKYLKERC